MNFEAYNVCFLLFAPKTCSDTALFINCTISRSLHLKTSRLTRDTIRNWIAQASKYSQCRSQYIYSKISASICLARYVMVWYYFLNQLAVLRMRFFSPRLPCHYQHSLVCRFCSLQATYDSPPKFEVILNVWLAHSLAFPPYIMLSLDPLVPEALWLWFRGDAVLARCMLNTAGVGESFTHEV